MASIRTVWRAQWFLQARARPTRVLGLSIVVLPLAAECLRRLLPASVSGSVSAAALLLPLFPLLGIRYALALWAAEPPRTRDDYRALPVPGRLHDLVRIAVGAVLLGLASLVAFGWCVVLAAVTNDAIPHVAWLATNCLVAALLPYAMGSALAVRLDAPAEWSLVVFAMLLFGGVLAARLELTWLLVPIETTLASPFGFIPVLLGWLTWAYPEMGPAPRSREGWMIGTLLWSLLTLGVLVRVAGYQPRRALLSLRSRRRP